MKEKLFNSIIAIMLAVNLTLTTLCLVRLKQPTKQETIPELTNMLYYESHDVTHLSLKNIFNIDSNNYLVYFYASNCSACQIANEYLAAFIFYGFNEVIDIYFVDVTNREELLADTQPETISYETFKVVNTPTILIFNDHDIALYEGSDKVYEILDGYVKGV